MPHSFSTSGLRSSLKPPAGPRAGPANGSQAENGARPAPRRKSAKQYRRPRPSASQAGLVASGVAAAQGCESSRGPLMSGRAGAGGSRRRTRVGAHKGAGRGRGPLLGEGHLLVHCPGGGWQHRKQRGPGAQVGRRRVQSYARWRQVACCMRQAQRLAWQPQQAPPPPPGSSSRQAGGAAHPSPPPCAWGCRGRPWRPAPPACAPRRCPGRPAAARSGGAGRQAGQSGGGEQVSR